MADKINDIFSPPEPNDRVLQTQLRKLHEVTTALSRADSLDELYRAAIVHGREILGFDRLGLLLLDEETMMVRGTFGTDEAGNLRDERAFIKPISETPLEREVIENKERVGFWVGEPLYDSWKVVGRGWRAIAVLWDGDKGIGWLATDNLTRCEPLQPHQLDILQLYGSSLGHLVTLKRTEFSLRESQERLQKLNSELEERVQTRTDHLEGAITKLAAEVAQHRAHEAEIDQLYQDLLIARDRALAGSRAKSTFLANMSHELRSPLNAIIGYAQLMAKDEGLASNHRLSVETILQSGEHLLRLINNVLNLSKIEAGRLQYQPTTFDLQKMLNMLGQMFRILAREKGLSFVVQRRSLLPEMIHTDEQKLRQILINLLANAVQYTAVGEVILRAWVTQRAGKKGILYLVVEDSGPGIHDEDLERIFAPFEQSGRLFEESDGTGLGLAICRQFAQLLDGRLRVESEIGQGTRFTVEVPISIVTSRPSTEAGKQAIVGIKPEIAEQLRVLIVDDQQENRQMLALFLKRHQLETRAVSNGQDALDVVATWQPHLILMDIRMPVMNGLEAAQRIRSVPGGHLVPIVALTASVFEEERNEVLAAGCDAFISKPFREEDVLKVLAHYLPVSLTYAVSATAVQKSVWPSVSELPTAVRENLYTAVLSAHEQRILALIAPLQDDFPHLVRDIRHLVNEFRYDLILDWITDETTV